jgi:hypothetical protein
MGSSAVAKSPADTLGTPMIFFAFHRLGLGSTRARHGGAPGDPRAFLGVSPVPPHWGCAFVSPFRAIGANVSLFTTVVAGDRSAGTSRHESGLWLSDSSPSAFTVEQL